MATAATPTIDPATDRAPRRRWRFPLSLRIFLVLLAILGLSCVWLGVRGYRQLIAIREIEKVGGNVRQSPVGMPWLRELVGEDRMRMFDDVTDVKLKGEQVTDAEMAYLRSLAKLEYVSIRNAPVTDQGLVHLRGLTNLQVIGLHGARVTIAGITALRNSLPAGTTQISW